MARHGVGMASMTAVLVLTSALLGGIVSASIVIFVLAVWLVGRIE